jgi:hypothetical protein
LALENAVKQIESDFVVSYAATAQLLSANGVHDPDNSNAQRTEQSSHESWSGGGCNLSLRPLGD